MKRFASLTLFILVAVSNVGCEQMLGSQLARSNAKYQQDEWNKLEAQKKRVIAASDSPSILEARAAQAAANRTLAECRQHATALDQPPKSGEPIGWCQAVQTFVGVWKGTVCPAKYSVEINISGATNDGNGAKFYGTYRLYDARIANGGLTKLLQIKLSLDTGFLHAAAANQSYHLDPVPLENIKMDLARDAAGVGLIGSAEYFGRDEQCELLLQRADARLDVLPPIGASSVTTEFKKSLNFASRGGAEYWFSQALSFPNTTAKEDRELGALAFDLAKGLKNGGTAYAVAMQKFLKSVTRTPHASTQAIISGMYAKGLGTKENPAEAKRWRDLSEKSMLPALKICNSEAQIKIVAGRVQRQLGGAAGAPEQAVKGFSAALGMKVAGTNLELVKISATEVATFQQQFVCEYTFARPDAEARIRSDEDQPALFDLLDSIASRFATTVFRMPIIETLEVPAQGPQRDQFLSSLSKPS